VLLAAIAVGAGVLTTAGYLISPETVRRQVLTEIRAVTGLNPELGGDTTVTVFPSGSVSFGDVVLGEGQQPALRAERLTARLRFFPLLVGRVEIADISLERPTIAVEVEPGGHSNWSGLIDALARSHSAQASSEQRVAAFSEMRIHNGTVLVRNAAKKVDEKFDDVTFSLAWPSISKSFGATGHFVWHAEPLDMTLTVSDFAGALAGTRTGIKLRVAGKQMKTAFEGAVSTHPTVRVEGTFAADAASLRDALTWAGQKPLPGGGFGRFAIKAHAGITAATVALSNVNLELDGNTAEGVLTFAADGRQTLQGTLASDTLDLTPYISTVKLLTANQREWNTSRITLDGLSSTDFDLRMSAANVVMSNAKLGRTAIGANLRNGHLVLTIGEAQAYGGVIKGSVELANFDSGVDLKSQLQFIGVDLESCLGQLFGLRRLEGKGDIAFAVEGTGDSVLAVTTQALNGTATLTGRSGAIAGLDVEQLLRRLERRPLSGAGDFRNGRTRFDTLAVALKITRGKVNVEDVTVTGPAVTLALTGSASIPAREVDLTGTAALNAEPKAGAAPFALPFMVQGPWDDPIMLPDAEALIRRSGAAAPLLNAVPERKARDAARSIIERLTGGVTPAAEPGDAAPRPEPK
jgi:AsmA protein